MFIYGRKCPTCIDSIILVIKFKQADPSGSAIFLKK